MCASTYYSKTDCQDYPLKSILNKQRFDSVITIGVLIKGDTAHFEHIAESVSRGLMRLQLDNNVSTFTFSAIIMISTNN